jgi:hypothetical protein
MIQTRRIDPDLVVANRFEPPSKDRLGVVGLVSERHEKGPHGLRRQLAEIGFLARSPCRFGLGPSVGAICHYLGDGIAEPKPDDRLDKLFGRVG